ncbi:protease propeptide/inhibitor [Ascodesmis nigricans]|uniref:Protease propeptide/inhibitor n=1 Tax=Ascodesmis nigricans TaxID=341454 RepID=A0A4S2MLH2_9PEZI|nr:protease propeptide/inhibitor [Ascodesmis nigricans]
MTPGAGPSPSTTTLRNIITKTLASSLKHRKPTAVMPQSYIITAKPDCTDDEVQALKQQCRDKGGKITHEYTIIKGFAVEYPDDAVMALADHPHVENVEQDQTVTTQ